MNPNAPFYGRGFDGNGLIEVHHSAWPGAMGWVVFALQLVLVAGIAWLIASAVLGRSARRAVPAVAAPGNQSAPLETLHMRYARGEIGRDEYLQAREDLGGPSEPSA